MFTPSEISSSIFLPTLNEQIEEAIKKKCEESFYFFVKNAWDHIDTQKYVDNWHIECLCVYLQAQFEDRIELIDITIPPGLAKSMIGAVLFPAWVWIKQPSTHLLTGSHSMDFAIRDSLKSRNLILSPWFRKNWGDLFSLASDQNVKKHYANNKGGYRLAISTTGTTGARGDIIIFDDAMSVTQADSEVERLSVNSYMRQTLFNRQNIMKKTKITIIGQRLHHDDYHSFFLSLPNCFHINLPMEFESHNAFKSGLFSDPRKEDKEILFKIPKFQGANLAILKETMGIRGWNTQYQQHTSVPEGEILKRTFWEYYDFKNIPSDLKIVSGWDFAAKAGQNNDFTVGITIGKHLKSYYVLGLYRKKVEFPQAKRDFIAECEKYSPKRIYIEDASNGTPLISEMQATSYKHKIMATPTKGKSKEDRVIPITPIIEAGNVFLPKDAPWLETFIEECANFPNGKHDDIVDALAIVLNNERNKNLPQIGILNI